MHDAHGLAGYRDGRRNFRGLVVHEHDIGRLDGRIRAHRAHGYANVGAHEHGRVVDAITHEGELAHAGSGAGPFARGTPRRVRVTAFTRARIFTRAFAAFTCGRKHLFDARHLVGRHELRVVLVDAKARGHGGRHLPGIAREHDRASHPGPLQGCQRLDRILFHHIGDDNVSNVGAVHGHVQDGADQLAFGERHSFGLHERAVAHKHAPPIHPRGHAGARALLHIGNAPCIKRARKPFPHACGDRMVGEGLGMRGQLQQRGRVCALLCMHGDDAEAAVGQSARLVEDDRAHLGKRLQIARAFH